MDPPKSTASPHRSSKASILHYFSPEKASTEASEAPPSLGPKSISTVVLPTAFAAHKARQSNLTSKRVSNSPAQSSKRAAKEVQNDDFPSSSPESSLETTRVAHEDFEGVDELLATYTHAAKPKRKSLDIIEGVKETKPSKLDIQTTDKINLKKRSREEGDDNGMDKEEGEEAFVLRPEKKAKTSTEKPAPRGVLIEDDGDDSDEDDVILSTVSMERRSTVIGVVRPKEEEEEETVRRHGPPLASSSASPPKPGSLKRRMMQNHGAGAGNRHGDAQDRSENPSLRKSATSLSNRLVSGNELEKGNGGDQEYMFTSKWRRTAVVEGLSPSKVVRRISWRRVPHGFSISGEEATGDEKTLPAGMWEMEPVMPGDVKCKSFLASDGTSLDADAGSGVGTSGPDHDGKIYLEIRHGDLTGEAVDCIVNAANSYLAHGGGVAGAISSKGGASIQRESDAWVTANGSVQVGNVAVTGSGRLPCLYVIHAVGPVYTNGSKKEETELFNAVYNSLVQADVLGCASISLPAISSGIFGYPKEEVATIFMKAVIKFILSASAPMPSSKGAIDIKMAGKNISTSSNSFSSSSTSQSPSSTSQQDSQESLHTTSPLSPHRIRSLRVIRFTNFDNPTVSVFQSKFDHIFQTLLRRQDQ